MSIGNTALRLADFIYRMEQLRFAIRSLRYRMVEERRQWALDVLDGQKPLISNRLLGPSQDADYAAQQKDQSDYMGWLSEQQSAEDTTPQDPFGESVYVQVNGEWVPDIPFLDFLGGWYE